MRTRSIPRRPGTTIVEAAVVLPVALLIIMGMIIMTLGVFRYLELAAAAREGARWASVRGHQYEQATRQLAATPQDVYTNAIQPRLAAMNPSLIGYSVTWQPDNRQGSAVIVTVNYQWLPEAFFGGATLTSTSKMMVTY